MIDLRRGLLAAATALALTGMVAAPTFAAEKPVAVGVPAVQPEKVGFSSERLARSTPG